LRDGAHHSGDSRGQTDDGRAKGGQTGADAGGVILRRIARLAALVALQFVLKNYISSLSLPGSFKSI
jgi:hypothetical protein